MTTTSQPQSPAALPAASDLTVEEQASLTAGADMWHSAGVERLGVPSFGLTDGPSGARGFQFTGATSASLPCGTALASTWNRELIERVGRLLGEEARAKGASVLLAPTINIQRHPLGGRSFEAYSEDPYLTGEIAVAFIEGVQSRGVACAVKHFALNDQETDRMEIDAVVDERTRREIYFPPFEAAVRRADVWSVMAAYNRVDGRYCSENRALLTDLLRGEWGFDGVVVSDWFGVHSADALHAGLDLEMPGPAQFLGSHLAAAVEAGDVDPDDVGRAAARVLGLIERTAPSRRPAEAGESIADPADAARVARQAATEGIVLLSNDGVLPLDPDAAPTIALIGWRADRPEYQGGGSAQVTPPYVSTPLHGITERAAPGAVTYETGRVVPRSSTISGRMAVAADGGHAVSLDYFARGDLVGEPIRRETLVETTATWFGEPAVGVAVGDFSARMATTFAPDATGRWTLAISGVGTGRLFLDGELIGDTEGAPAGSGLLGIFTVPVECEVELVAGTTYEIVAELDAAPVQGPIALDGLTISVSPPARADAVEQAVRAASEAAVAVVVVGHEEPITEGADAVTIDLPSEQVELIERVAAANPRTIVVVNAATPVTMDWADAPAAVVQLGYLGQETGAALAAVLFGDADASGRLTTTFPVRLADAPAFASFPGRDGSVSYEEGVFVGYRHYDTRGLEPRWCFGHGLSYTTFAYSSLTVSEAANGFGAVVSVEVTNTGERPGSEVVQVYLRHVDAEVERPDRELKGFEKVTLDPGAAATVDITLDERAFAFWDTERAGWHAPAGAYEILVGSSSRDIRRSVVLTRSTAWTG